jgi:hypothetical protein
MFLCINPLEPHTYFKWHGSAFGYIYISWCNSTSSDFRFFFFCWTDNGRCKIWCKFSRPPINYNPLWAYQTCQKLNLKFWWYTNFKFCAGSIPSNMWKGQKMGIDRTLWPDRIGKNHDIRLYYSEHAFIVNLKVSDLLGNTTKVRPNSWTREHWNTGERIFCKILGFSPFKMVQECGLMTKRVQQIMANGYIHWFGLKVNMYSICGS